MNLQWSRRRSWPLVLGLTPALLQPGCGDDPARLARDAHADWSAGRLERSEEALERLAKVRPLTVPERILRAQVARQRGRLDEAVAALGAPSANSSRAEAAQIAAARGTIELLRHHFRDAEKALEQALALAPETADARRELIHLLAMQGRHADLPAHFQKLAATTPSSGAAPLGFADLFLWTIGRPEDLGPDDLAELLKRAVEADPGDRLSRLALADNLRRIGQLDEALVTLGPLPSDDSEAQSARARIALDRGDERAAELLLANVPGPAAGRLRGRIALTRGDADASAREYRAALEVEPQNRDGMSGLGQALRLAGDPEGAQPYARAAREHDRLEWLIQNARTPARREDPRVLREIAEVCLNFGRRDEARAWYRLALTRDPLDLDLQKGIYRLDAERTPNRGAAREPRRLNKRQLSTTQAIFSPGGATVSSPGRQPWVCVHATNHLSIPKRWQGDRDRDDGICRPFRAWSGGRSSIVPGLAPWATVAPPGLTNQ
jgi:tetratricopeptide (TPR) repeat protein